MTTKSIPNEIVEIWHQRMKVFISWSGENSRKIAGTLHEWLPYVIQAIKPFISSDDIFKGERWSDMLAKELEDTQFGIICLTPSNINSPWLNFEAGALSKSIERSSLAPFLFKIDPNRVKGPLALFQSTTTNKEDIFNLLTSINKQLDPTIRLDLTLLRETFETWWPKLQKALEQATQTYENASGYDWLYDPVDLPIIQRSINCKSIWVAISHTSDALETICQRNMVEENIKHGVKYRLIFQQLMKDETDEIREYLCKIFEEHSAERDVCEIPTDEFKNLVLTDFLILNPKVDDEQHPLKVILKLPVEGQDYWIEVDERIAHKFVGRFDKMCEKSGTFKIRTQID